MNPNSQGISGTVTDPVEDDDAAAAMAADLSLFFYAVGLLVPGFAGLLVVG